MDLADRSEDQRELDGHHGKLKQRDRFELLILSEAGKPIYSYSKRDDAVTLVPLCSALINYAQKAQKETLRTITTSANLVISFTTRKPLIIIVIYESNSFIDPLILVDQVEAQVISILTAKTLRSVFEERPTFDLKRLLYGSEKLIDSIANLSANEAKLEWPWAQAFIAISAQSSSSSPSSSQTPNTSLSQIRPHRVLIPIVFMTTSARENVHNILNNTISSNTKNMVFSLLFRIERSVDEDPTLSSGGPPSNTQDPETGLQDDVSDNREASVTFKLVVVCNHHDKYKLKTADIHIIWALLNGSRAQLSSVESLWLPVCLPRFNQDAFLHSYISYTNSMKHCLVMMSVDRDEFSVCQQARNSIEDKLSVLLKDPNQRPKIYYQLSPLVHPILLELQDKLVGNTLDDRELAEAQQQTQIYNSKNELYHARQLQFLWYQTSKQVLWWQRSAQKPLSPVMYYVTKKMLQSSLKTLWLKLADDSIFLGWHVPTFQLYAQFDPTITTNEATEVIQKITNWIKKEEDNFSVKDYR